MAAGWLRFRADLRTRWRAWLGLALLVGVAGGVRIALAAGTRRTDTAYARLLDAQRPYDVIVFAGGLTGDVPTPPDFLDRVEQLPHGALLVLVPVTLVVVNLVAAVPAWLAARTRPATVLRSE